MKTHMCRKTWNHMHKYAPWEETGHHIGGGDSYLHMWDGLSFGGELVAGEIFIYLFYFAFAFFFLYQHSLAVALAQ